MPAAVKNVAWKCEYCGKRRWLKPGRAKSKRYCSRACYHAALRVDKPSALKPTVTFGTRTCPQCDSKYEAKAAHQRFCSQSCSTRNAQSARRRRDITQRPCEHCGEAFRPRPGSAGRFCSWDCKVQGQRGEKAAHYRGGRFVTRDGYVKVLVPDHPAAHGRGGYVSEHRLVMERVLGRHLERHETVHHINGNKADNRPANLQLRSGRHGKGVVHQCKDCGSSNVESVVLH